MPDEATELLLGLLFPEVGELLAEGDGRRGAIPRNLLSRQGWRNYQELHMINKGSSPKYTKLSQLNEADSLAKCRMQVRTISDEEIIIHRASHGATRSRSRSCLPAQLSTRL